MNEERNKNNQHTTPIHFWRNKLTWRSTNTGMNQNVINTYSPYNCKRLVIAHMRLNTTPYTDKRKFLGKESKKKHDYFVDVVDDCMRRIWNGQRGYVYSDSQLKEVMKILPSVNVSYEDSDGCYYCWK